MTHWLSCVGMSVSGLGLLMEAVAVAGMTFYPVRRVLPVKTPFVLQSTGCFTFYLGVVVLAIGQMFG